jgi:hypothetical protein
MKVFLATVLAVGAMAVGTTPHGVAVAESESGGTGEHSVFRGVEIPSGSQHYKVVLPDCEDLTGDSNGPCVTFDDQPGGWVEILQYEPTFKEKRIRPPHKNSDGTYTLR